VTGTLDGIAPTIESFTVNGGASTSNSVNVLISFATSDVGTACRGCSRAAKGTRPSRNFSTASQTVFLDLTP
jgi:hypothetical protein